MPASLLTWRDVRSRIHKSILDGKFAPGDRLPRDADIAADLQCARSTVQRAMQNLADRGLVERRRKGGTHVSAQPVTRATLDIPVTRDEIEARGRQYSCQLIRRSVKPPPVPIAGAFALKSPQPMLHILALHMSDGQPYIFEDRWVSTETVPEILEVDLSEISANEWLVKNRPISSASIRLYAEPADTERAEILGCRHHDALFIIDRTTWIESMPITCVKASCAPGYQLQSTI